MTALPANAALWFAKDGYVVTKDTLNGRRVAGASFLKGFLDHAQADTIYGMSKGPKALKTFKKIAAEIAPDRTIDAFLETDIDALRRIGCVYYPSPGLAELSWLRHYHGTDTYSICGITHTTATDRVMQSMFDLYSAPVHDWDAVICTSQSVVASLRSQFDDCDAYFRDRFGTGLPARVQLPVIPLGIDTAAFAPDAKARAKARADRGFDGKDIVLMTLARLSPHEKFDPLPYFRAVQEAQTQLKKTGQRLHVVMCGLYKDSYSEKIFVEGAEALMPDVPLIQLDGGVADDRATAFALADVFSFPIDNIQETFGLAPIEGMAAGLPVLCSDWDGMKDTISADVGIRVPTLMASADTLTREAWWYQNGKLSYPQYTSQVSGMTIIDHAAWVTAIVALAQDSDLRARLGAAGLKRAKDQYDWAAVIPQMQALWGELAARRAKARPLPLNPGHSPVAPSPGRFFASYPTEQFDTTPRAVRIAPSLRTTDATEAVDTVIKLHRYKALGCKPASRAVFIRLLTALQETPEVSLTPQSICAATTLPSDTVERGLLWLVKFGFAEFCAP